MAHLVLVQIYSVKCSQFTANFLPLGICHLFMVFYQAKQNGFTLPFVEELNSYGDFEPQSILCDYEKGLHNALHKVWPGSTIHGSYFHYKQCLWWKLQAYELTSEYKVVNSPIRISFKQIGALPFVCPGTFGLC